MTRYAHLMDLDARLAALDGWHGMSPFWRDTVAAMYAAEPDVAIGRVGRQGGKSTTWCRVAVAEATCGTWNIPPDSTPMFVIMSADRDQAADRVKTCKTICEVLQIEHEATASVIRFPKHGTEIGVKTASPKGAVSKTCIGGLLDEMALWRVEGANPAAEVIQLLEPSLITQPGAFLSFISAPWTTRDPHAQEYDRVPNEGEVRFKFHAPTWVANPKNTEAWCRKKARTAAAFSQYSAVPLDGVGEFAFAPSVVAKAMRIEVAA